MDVECRISCYWHIRLNYGVLPMITFATVTTIDDSEFDNLFAASLPSLNAGSYPWALYGNLTDAQKKEHIRAGFDRMLTEGFLWRVSDDDGALLLND